MSYIIGSALIWKQNQQEPARKHRNIGNFENEIPVHISTVFLLAAHENTKRASDKSNTLS
jgi:hypothetical protein